MGLTGSARALRELAPVPWIGSGWVARGGGVPPLELGGSQLADRGMPSLAVEEHLDVVEWGGLDRGPRRGAVAVDQLALQRAEEALRDGVVVGVAERSHRRRDPRSAHSTSERERGVLTGLGVGVMHEPGLRPAPRETITRIELPIGAILGPDPSFGGIMPRQLSDADSSVSGFALRRPRRQTTRPWPRTAADGWLPLEPYVLSELGTHDGRDPVGRARRHVGPAVPW